MIDGALVDLPFYFPFGILVGIALEMHSARNFWRGECIKRGVARYHPQTGKWELTVEDKK